MYFIRYPNNHFFNFSTDILFKKKFYTFENLKYEITKNYSFISLLSVFLSACCSCCCIIELVFL